MCPECGNGIPEESDETGEGPVYWTLSDEPYCGMECVIARHRTSSQIPEGARMNAESPERSDRAATEGSEPGVSEFLKELAALINRHSRENGSDTPDFLLAQHLSKCLDNLDVFVRARDAWYGVQHGPGAGAPSAHAAPEGPMTERGPSTVHVILDEVPTAGEVQ